MSTTGNLKELLDKYEKEGNKYRILDALRLFYLGRKEEYLINQIPVLNGKILDLYELLYYVQLPGGHDKLKGNDWEDVAVKLGLPNKSFSNVLQQAYSRFLLPFEYQMRMNRARAAQRSQAVAAQTQSQNQDSARLDTRPIPNTSSITQQAMTHNPQSQPYQQLQQQMGNMHPSNQSMSQIFPRHPNYNEGSNAPNPAFPSSSHPLDPNLLLQQQKPSYLRIACLVKCSSPVSSWFIDASRGRCAATDVIATSAAFIPTS